MFFSFSSFSFSFDTVDTCTIPVDYIVAGASGCQRGAVALAFGGCGCQWVIPPKNECNGSFSGVVGGGGCHREVIPLKTRATACFRG